VAGVPVAMHWSVTVVFALVTWELAAVVFPDAYGGGAHLAYWAAAIVAAALFFLSLLAHEASHAVVARHYGVGVRSITLWIFGGVAQLEGEAYTPGQDFTIADDGPGMSLALAGVFGAVQLVLERAGAHGLPADVPSWLWQINLLLAGFNLIPTAPLDGGRILRAGLWRATGNRSRATAMAARAGLGFGVVLMALGAAEFLLLSNPFGLWPAFLGWFLFTAARAELEAARLQRGTDCLGVGDVMVPAPTVPCALTVEQLLAGQWPW
jgi:Zn-dependent protease